MTFHACNPTTGELVQDVASLTAQQGEDLLATTHAQQQAWRRLTLMQRTPFVHALGAALRHRREALAAMLTLEMGKPINAARAEIDKCALLCDLAPDMAVRALADEVLVDDATALVRVRHDPLGTVLAIMPWNFPHWQSLRFAVPALLAGNGVLIKPAGSVPGSAVLLNQCFVEARANTHNSAGVDAPIHIALFDVDALDSIIADDRIVGVTLTGSDRAGRHVAEVAGAHLKKVVLELGGSDPFIVLPGADVVRAATVAVAARTVNSGQSCIAAKRFIVCDAVYDEFLTHFIDGMSHLVVGDPRDERTQIGPIATASVRDGLAEQVETSTRMGARIALGGGSATTPGYFYPPTVLVDIPDNAPAARQELFGPVASVFRVADVNAAIAKANDSAFGLGASVWSRDPATIDRCIAELDAGMVFINDMVASDPRFPFGGIKQSGVGRELGAAGFREFTNAKTVYVHR